MKGLGTPPAPVIVATVLGWGLVLYTLVHTLI
jgi:hypothetical protein